MKCNITCTFPIAEILQSRGLGTDKAAQVLLAQTTAELAQAYVPYRTGFLAEGSVEIAPDGSTLSYTAPYAAKQFYETAAQYSNNTSGLRGKQWIARMKADHAATLTQAVAQRVGGIAQCK